MNTIIIDTREKKYNHITSFFLTNNIPFKHAKLDFGDYAIEGYQNILVIERKASIDEISGNFFKNRKRFENELQRAKDSNCRIKVLLETGNLKQIMEGCYKSNAKPESFVATLKSFEYRYNTSFDFIDFQNSGYWIYINLFYGVKELLKQK